MSMGIISSSFVGLNSSLVDSLFAVFRDLKSSTPTVALHEWLIDRSKKPGIEIIVDYLRAEFPGFSVEHNCDGTRGYRFLLWSGDQSHLVTVREDFLSQNDAAQIKACMSDYWVRLCVMRRWRVTNTHHEQRLYL